MSSEQHNPEAPSKLAADLRGLYRAPIAVDARVDDTVLALARLRSGRAGSTRRLTRWGMVAAAGLAVGVFLTARMAWPGRPSPARVAIAEDINGDGVVDILDALALERAIERSAVGLKDLNGDGVVDRKDVDRIAMQAVQLIVKPRGNG